MVDYKLVIDIDENELVRKLNNALKKAGALGFSASGSGGAQRQARPGYSPSIGLSEAGARKVAEYQSKRDAYERSKINIMNLEFAKKSAFQEQKHANMMERLQTGNNSWQKKMFSIGTVVKLAGLATGVAGLLQFRKMIIDSSPMLQAMLRLLDTGVMFYLRPIGDFIGFFLRPLLIPFLKAAVKFYSSKLPFIIKTGEEGGQAALSGDWLGVGKSINDFFYGLTHDLRDAETQKNMKMGDDFKTAVDKWWRDATLGWDKFWGKSMFLGAAYACGGGQIAPCGKEYFGPGFGGTTGKTGDIMPDTRTGGVNYTRSLSDSMSTGDSLGKGGTNTNAGFQSQFYDPMEKQRQQFSSAYVQAQEKYIKSITGGAYAKPDFLCGGYGGSQVRMELFEEQLNEAKEQKKILTESGRSTDSIDIKIGKLEDSIVRELKALNAKAGMYEGKGSIGINTGSFTGGSPYGTAPPGNYLGSNGKVYGSYEDAKKNNPDSEPTPTKRRKASGGMINEMIYGTGVSGQKYTFGESGPEMIVPSGQTNQAVGQFQGASNYKIKSQYDKMIQLKQMMEEAHSIYGPQVSAVTSAQSKMRVPTLHGKINRSRIGAYRNKMKGLERRGSALSALQHQFDSGYKDSLTAFGSSYGSAGESGVLSALGGERTREITGGSNTFNINISKASNIEDLVRQLGPKILKYLQENDARAGIR